MSTIASLTTLLQDYQKAASSAGSTSPNTSVSDIVNGDTASSYGNAYVLDLSQAAQDILNSKSSSGSTSVIKLSDAQKEKLNTILEKYKDAPLNNDTLSALNADLQKAGLAPDELATIQQAKDFNPIQVFLQILNGLSDENSSSSNDGLAGLSSTASGTPLGDLINQFKALNSGSASKA